MPDGDTAAEWAPPQGARWLGHWTGAVVGRKRGSQLGLLCDGLGARLGEGDPLFS